jgi:hypothetical protein
MDSKELNDTMNYLAESGKISIEATSSGRGVTYKIRKGVVT